MDKNFLTEAEWNVRRSLEEQGLTVQKNGTIKDQQGNLLMKPDGSMITADDRFMVHTASTGQKAAMAVGAAFLVASVVTGLAAGVGVSRRVSPVISAIDPSIPIFAGAAVAKGVANAGAKVVFAAGDAVDKAISPKYNDKSSGVSPVTGRIETLDQRGQDTLKLWMSLEERKARLDPSSPTILGQLKDFERQMKNSVPAFNRLEFIENETIRDQLIKRFGTKFQQNEKASAPIIESYLDKNIRPLIKEWEEFEKTGRASDDRVLPHLIEDKRFAAEYSKVWSETAGKSFTLIAEAKDKNGQQILTDDQILSYGKMASIPKVIKEAYSRDEELSYLRQDVGDFGPSVQARAFGMELKESVLAPAPIR